MSCSHTKKTKDLIGLQNRYSLPTKKLVFLSHFEWFELKWSHSLKKHPETRSKFSAKASKKVQTKRR